MRRPAHAAPQGAGGLDNIRGAGRGAVGGRPVSVWASGMAIGLGPDWALQPARRSARQRPTMAAVATMATVATVPTRARPTMAAVATMATAATVPTRACRMTRAAATSTSWTVIT